MELFGILLSVPVAFIASLVYCLLLANLVVRFDRIRHWLWWVSIVVLAGFVTEVLLLAMVGATKARTMIGPGFYAAHVLLFFLSTPALANVLMLRKHSRLIGRWYVAVPLCTAFRAGSGVAPVRSVRGAVWNRRRQRISHEISCGYSSRWDRRER